MEFAVAVKCLLKNETGEYLLLVKTKEEPPMIMDDSICLGGRLCYKEDLQTALLREVYEETGLQLTDKKLSILDVSSIIRKDGLHLIVITYLYQIKKQPIQLSEEHSAFFLGDVNKRSDAYLDN